MTLQTIEERLFERYRYYVGRQIQYKNSGVVYHWEVIGELEMLLDELFSYNFPYNRGKYYAIKDGKIVYEYVYE